MNETNEERDDMLGRELRAIDLPEERPDFFDALQAKLDAPLEKPAKRRFLVPMAGTAVAASIVASLLVVSAQRESDTSSRFAVPTTTTPSTSPATVPPEEKLTAIQVVARVEKAYAETKAIKGTLIQEFYAPAETEGAGNKTTHIIDLLYTSTGSLRSTEVDGDTTTNRYYDSTVGDQTEVRIEKGQPASVSVYKSMSGWYAGNVLFQSASGYAQTFRDSANTNLTEITFEGKDAWQLAKRLGKIEVRLVADKETGYPLQLSGSDNGKPVFVHTLKNFQVNPEFAATDFTPVIPKGAIVQADSNDALQRVTPEQASKLAGYPYVHPTYVPEGFQLVGISYKRSDTSMAGDGQQVIATVYRRGMATIEFVTSLRSTTDMRYLPWEGDVGWETMTQSVLTSGIYAGKQVDVEDDLLSSPTIYGDGNKVSFGIHGGVSHDELLKMANSITDK
jgi:hypothetical protein